jgi:hypothetical protein
MKEIMIATDVVLEAIIGRTPGLADELIAQAQKGEAQLNILHSTLYSALYSVDPRVDKVNVQRLAQLLKYSQILPDAELYTGPQERDAWVPTEEEITNWREIALRDESRTEQGVC